MPKITHVPASTSRKIPICTCASEPMRLTKLKPNPVMVTTPMTMPTQAQHAAIHEQVRRRVFHGGEETGRGEACFRAQERQGNHGGAGEQGREDDAPSGDHEDDEQGQGREVVELALDGAQFGDEIGRRAPPSPVPERLKVDHGEQG